MRSTLLLAILFCLVLAVIPGFAVGANRPLTARVLQVGSYGNGNAYIFIDQAIPDPECPKPAIEIPANNPALRTIVATAQMSMALDIPVEIFTDSCLQGTPSFSGNRNAYFLMKKPM